MAMQLTYAGMSIKQTLTKNWSENFLLLALRNRRKPTRKVATSMMNRIVSGWMIIGDEVVDC